MRSDAESFADGIGIGIQIGLLHANGAKELAAKLLQEVLPNRPIRPARGFDEKLPDEFFTAANETRAVLDSVQPEEDGDEPPPAE